MDRLTLFIEGCKAERWRWRAWRISLFTITQLNDDDREPYDLDYRQDGVYYYTSSGEWERVTDADPEQSLCDNRELATFPAGSIPTVDGPIETTYGRMLFNWMVMFYAFGTRLPFQHKTTPSAIVKLFVDKVEDEVDLEGNPIERKPDAFYPSDIQRFVEGLFELTSLCPYITPTGGVRSLTTHPDMAKVRDALYEKYADQLHDATVVAMIQNELVKLDKEWNNVEDSKGFYISNSTFTVKRKKMFMTHGIENAFKENGEFELIKTSLAEGVDMSKLPEMFNSTREGSLDRGLNTAKGGEKVSLLQRMFQNERVIDTDCGTKRRHHVLLNEHNYAEYLDFNFTYGTVTERLTEENAKAHFGKVIGLRRFFLCEQGGGEFCGACGTKALAASSRTAAAEISDMGSDIMYAFMSSMHGTELAVAEFDPLKHVS